MKDAEDSSMSPSIPLIKELRFNRNLVIRDTSNTKYGDLTFGKFFAKFINLFFDLINSNINEKQLY